VQGFVEQARNALYSYLHHLRSFHSDSFNWAELLPSVTYIHNTAVQTQKSELPMLQLDGRDNRLANANTLMTDEVLQKDEYRRHFNASFGTCFEQHQQTNDGLCNSNNDSDNRDGSTQGTSQLTNTYEARQQRAAADHTRSATQPAPDGQANSSGRCSFHSGRYSACSRTAALPDEPRPCATIVGRVRSVHVAVVERRYRIATPAGILSRMLSGTDLAKRIEGVVLRLSDIDTLASASEEIRLQHAIRCAFGCSQEVQPRAATAEQRTRQPPGEWWRSL
jgi:hypothetical protein